MAKSTGIYAKAVGSFVPQLTRKSFEKYGFSTASLLTDWPLIAGADLSRDTVPERLQWPRGADNSLDTGGEGRPGAVLVLRVDPARALDIEYNRVRIAERINSYFGYGAISGVRIVQGPMPRPEACNPANVQTLQGCSDPVTYLPPALAQVTDDGLRAALALLNANITSQVRHA